MKGAQDKSRTMKKFNGRYRWRSAAGELMEKLVPFDAPSKAAAKRMAKLHSEQNRMWLIDVETD